MRQKFIPELKAYLLQSLITWRLKIKKLPNKIKEISA